MHAKNLIILFSLGFLLPQEGLCTKTGHTVVKKKWVNKKTGEVRFSEQVTHHAPVDINPGLALIHQVQSDGIETSAVVNRDDLNETAHETGISALPFKSGSRYELESGSTKFELKHSWCNETSQNILLSKAASSKEGKLAQQQ